MRPLAFIVMLAACGDNLKQTPGEDAGVAVPDAAHGLRHCIDRPELLAQPPNGQLPCDLLPPGFGP